MPQFNAIPTIDVNSDMNTDAELLWKTLLYPDVPDTVEVASPRMVILKGLFADIGMLNTGSEEHASKQNVVSKNLVLAHKRNLSQLGYDVKGVTTLPPFDATNSGPHVDWPSVSEIDIPLTLRIWRGNLPTEVGARSSSIKDQNQYNGMFYATTNPIDGVMFVSLSNESSLPMCRHDFRRGLNIDDVICISKIVLANTATR